MLQMTSRTIEDVDLLEQQAVQEARKSFWAYRQYMHPTMLKGWFQRDVARHLQQFWLDFRAGRRPILLLIAPPQHGKSWQVVDFIGWSSGLDPSLQTIYSSFSDRLGVRANLWLQRMMDTEKYQNFAPDTVLEKGNVVAVSGRHLRNKEILEFVGQSGSFRNTTVLGAVTGEGLSLGVVDDPIRGRKDANSPAVRDSTWDWFTDDFFSRFSEHAGLIMMLTRWHMDDPAGRLLEKFGDKVKVLRYPAIAEEDEEHRARGEPLFPELKSLAFLNDRRSIYTSASWESIYQGNPFVQEGSLFVVSKLDYLVRAPHPREVVASVRYWDKAGTQDEGAYTAGVLMHKMKDGSFLVSDVCRGQWSFGERERIIRQTAATDNATWGFVRMYVEQEPGSGGKESAQRTIQNLPEYAAFADRVTGDKITRSEPFAAQVENGNVGIVVGPWSGDFVEELRYFPSGKYKDQVDAASGAYAKLTEAAQRIGALW